MERQALESPKPESGLPVEFAPRLIIDTEPAYRVFLRNLTDTIFPHRIIRHEHGPEWPELWPDVFVCRRIPWWGFLQSVAVHMLVVGALWGASRMWALRPQVLPQPVFSKQDVIYFPASEYLPPLDTGNRTVAKQQKGDPRYSRQAILSVPPEADNRTQTVVTPPAVKLKNELPLPNIVAWKTVNPSAPIDAAMRLKLPTQPMDVIAPAPTIEPAADRRRLQAEQAAVIAPPPEVGEVYAHAKAGVLETAIIEPPPAVKNQIRQYGDINIGHSDVVPPAPELVLHEQRTSSYNAAAISGNSTLIVPPPPSVGGSGVSGLRGRTGVSASMDVVPPPASAESGARSENRIVALGLHPVAGAPPVAAGNRRGSFAMSPSGRVGGPGTPDVRSGGDHGSSATGTGARADLPSGLLVQPGPASSTHADGANAEDSSSAVIAEAKPPLRVSPARRALASTSEPTAEEREVFGDRKFYSMTLNMPNLNSAGGSWVIRFAELKDGMEAGDLTAPEALRKVDPAYPLELMRTRIEGKVTLYAVIHSDGSVGDVRVLNSVDERLDEYACAALSRWRFRPATKAGAAVALQAVVTIPFRARPAF